MRYPTCIRIVLFLYPAYIMAASSLHRNNELLGDEVPFTPVTSQQPGYYSSISEALTRTCRNREEFESLWRRHRGSSSDDVAVEFDDTTMVLCVFRGQRNSGGYGIRIESVTHEDEQIVVRCLTSDPPPGAMATMALTQPHHVVAVPRSPLAVRYVVEPAPPPPRPFPTFLLTLHKEVTDLESMRTRLERLDAVRGVTILKAVRLAMVEFDESKLLIDDGNEAETQAQALLEAVEGVATVEMDSPPAGVGTVGGFGI